MLETFQVLSVSSLGIWLGDGEGKMGRRVDEIYVWGKEVCGPDTAVPMVGENLFIGVDELV